MNITLHNVTVYITMVTFAVWVAKCLIVSPLEASNRELRRAIEKLEQSLSMLDDKIDVQRERLSLVEASAHSAHKRIDRIETIIDEKGIN